MEGLIDFHAHILPGMDDGSDCLETSLEMLRMESRQGIAAVVATPHFYPWYETPESFVEKRDRAEALLRAAMNRERDLPRLLVGAEVYYFPGISESEVLKNLTIRGTDCVLIEMPPMPWSESALRELADIREKRELTPIIAHIDRYIGPFRTGGLPEHLARMPVLVQANASFFLRRSTRRMALSLLKRGWIQLLGSDCHSAGTRCPNLGPAVALLREKLGEEVIARIQGYENIVLDTATRGME